MVAMQGHDDAATAVFGKFWPAVTLRNGDDAASKLRRQTSDRYRILKTPAQVRALAAPALATPLTTRSAAHRAMLALYYRALFVPRAETMAQAKPYWVAFQKFGDHSSPEFARLACGVRILTGVGRIHWKVAEQVLKRYAQSSDCWLLAANAADVASAQKQVPGLLWVGDVCLTRTQQLKSTTVLDYVGMAPRSTASLRFIAATAYDDAALLATDRNYAKRALAILDALVADPTTPPLVRTQAKERASGSRKRPFMR